MPLCEETLHKRIIRMHMASLFKQINVFIVYTEMINVSFFKNFNFESSFQKLAFFGPQNTTVAHERPKCIKSQRLVENGVV